MLQLMDLIIVIRCPRIMRTENENTPKNDREPFWVIGEFNDMLVALPKFE